MPYPSLTAFPNRFRQDLTAGKLLIGCGCSLGSPITTEILGLAGFDWLLLDSDQSNNCATSHIFQLMALKGSASAVVARPERNDAVLINKLLDDGIHNFVIPDVESRDDAENAVTATRYPPSGGRNVSPSNRGNCFGTLNDYMKMANENITIAAQIDSYSGMMAVKEICSVDGIDGIFVSLAGIAAALGYIGEPSHPEVQAAVSHVFSAARCAGKPIGLFAADHNVRPYIEKGATFVIVGSDQDVFRSATQALQKQYLEHRP